MVKNSFISVIAQEEKEETKGYVEFQVFGFTNKIRRLTSHLELHKNDFLSQRGLRKILGKRQRLLKNWSYPFYLVLMRLVLRKNLLREG